MTVRKSCFKNLSWKQLGWFVEIRSMHVGLSGFLKNVGFLIRLVSHLSYKIPSNIFPILRHSSLTKTKDFDIFCCYILLKYIFSHFMATRIHSHKGCLIVEVTHWHFTGAAWKVYIFRLFLVSIFRHLDCVQMRENTDQKNSKYGHFSRSEGLMFSSECEVLAT